MLAIRAIEETDGPLVHRLLMERWGSTEMIVRAERVKLQGAMGFIAFDGGEAVGIVTFRMLNGICEILSLDSLRENLGIGTALMNRVAQAARADGCNKLMLITTNDNMRALRFYQKYGMDMVCLHHNAMEISRKLKPSIPLLGMDGIPLKHEIQMEMKL